MKGTFLIFITAALLCAMSVHADIGKRAQAQAKELAKDGWMAFPGMLSVAEQLEGNMRSEMEFTSHLSPRYVMADGESEFCPSLAQAEAQAIAMAKIYLVESADTTHHLESVMAFTDNSEDELLKQEGSVYTTEYDMQTNGDKKLQYTTKYYKDKKLITSHQVNNSDKTIIYWENVLCYSDISPIARTAWYVKKLYRVQNNAYQVKVTLCNYALNKEE